MFSTIKAVYNFAISSRLAPRAPVARKGKPPVVTINKRSISPPLTAISVNARVYLTNADSSRHEDAYSKPEQLASTMPLSDSVQTMGSVYSTVTDEVTGSVGRDDEVKYVDVNGQERGSKEPLPLDGRFPSSESYAPHEESLPWVVCAPPQLEEGGSQSNSDVCRATRPQQMEKALSNDDVRELIRRRIEAREGSSKEGEDDVRPGARLSRGLALGKKAGREVKERCPALKPYELPPSDYVNVREKDDEWMARYRAIRARSKSAFV